MRGHNCIVVLELSARREDLTDVGFVRGYRQLDAFKKWMEATLDHRHLTRQRGPPRRQKIWPFGSSTSGTAGFPNSPR
ncbi:hypothetical protein [Streptomyces sp. NPDC048637]|uniref:hypothetical protein n=1 Tax=Streptomyces sp. NPDC048637 TaxID=3155636 RepID=UPI00344ACABA